MADQYVDATYVKAFIGTGLHDALTGVTGVSLTQHIESATALVQSYLRNNGYSTPTTTTDETVKSAVMGAVWETLASLPEKAIPLPPDWQTHPLKIALVGVLSGDAQVTHALTKSSAVGGWKWSEHRDSVSDTRTQRASRDELKGW